MNLNSVQLGGIKFAGKHSRADGKLYTVIDVPKDYDEDKLNMLFDLVRLKNKPVISYFDMT